MIFEEHTTTDYAIKENSIMYDLDAATVCFFAKDTDDNKPGRYGCEQCVYSYNVAGTVAGNALLLCTTPKLNVYFDNTVRYAEVVLDYGKWNHVCFTWSSANGDYKFYKDGVLDQDTVGGGFNVDQSFVGEVTEVNVWGNVLSESDIVAQASNCHVTQGSVNWWSQFKDGVHGGVQIVEP
ncbi:hypothetical protein ACROYT_G018719 [Oculina patagonica]